MKSGHGKPYFFFRAYLKLYLRMCLKAEDTLKVKNALIKAFCVMEDAICSLIIKETVCADTLRLEPSI
jgi:hypothetical protein